MPFGWPVEPEVNKLKKSLFGLHFLNRFILFFEFLK